MEALREVDLGADLARRHESECPAYTALCQRCCISSTEVPHARRRPWGEPLKPEAFNGIGRAIADRLTVAAYSKTITLRAAVPRRSASKVSFTPSSGRRAEIISSRRSRPLR